jgi:hypothetical protein
MLPRRLPSRLRRRRRHRTTGFFLCAAATATAGLFRCAAFRYFIFAEVAAATFSAGVTAASAAVLDEMLERLDHRTASRPAAGACPRRTAAAAPSSSRATGAGAASARLKAAARKRGSVSAMLCVPR